MSPLPLDQLPIAGKRPAGKPLALGGLIVAAFLAVPIVNLLTPLFAASMMVHLHKLLSVRDPSFSDSLRR